MDDATISSLKKIGTIESYGDGGSFKGAVLVEFKKFDELPEEMTTPIPIATASISDNTTKTELPIPKIVSALPVQWLLGYSQDRMVW